MPRIARSALACCTLLALGACAKHDRVAMPGDGRTPSAANSDTVRTVMGQTVTQAPLVPEPGDIWADLRFLKQQPAPVQSDPTPVTRPPASAVAAVPVERPSQTVAIRASYSVQLSAANSEGAAHTVWQQLLRRMPDLLGQRAPSVVSAQIDGHTLWRLRTGSFATQADAATFCDRVLSMHGQCWVVANAS